MDGVAKGDTARPWPLIPFSPEKGNRQATGQMRSLTMPLSTLVRQISGTPPLELHAGNVAAEVFRYFGSGENAAQMLFEQAHG